MMKNLSAQAISHNYFRIFLAVFTAIAIFVSSNSLTINIPFVGNYKNLLIPALALLIILDLAIINNLKEKAQWRKLDFSEYFPFLIYLFSITFASVFSISPDRSLRQILILIFFFLIYFSIVQLPEYSLFLGKCLAVSMIISASFSFLLPLSFKGWIKLDLASLFKAETLDYNRFALLRLDRNVSVGSFFLTIPLFYYYYWFSRFNPLPKLNNFFKFNLILISMATILTNGRAMVITAVFSLFLYFYLVKSILKQKFFKFKKNASILLLLLFASLVSMLLAYKIFGVNILSRLFLIREKDRQSIVARFNYLSIAVNIFKAKPFYGVGVNNYRFVEPESSLPDNPIPGLFTNTDIYKFSKADHAHNAFFTHLAETGVFGTASLIFLFYSILKYDIFHLNQLKKVYKNQELNAAAFHLSQISISWSFIVISIVAGEWTAYSLLVFFVSRGLVVATRQHHYQKSNLKFS